MNLNLIVNHPNDLSTPMPQQLLGVSLARVKEIAGIVLEYAQENKLDISSYIHFNQIMSYLSTCVETPEELIVVCYAIGKSVGSPITTITQVNLNDTPDINAPISKN